MQGKKVYQEKLFTQFRLSERVPKDNFYRQLKEVLDLTYLYPLTKKYYGNTGQKSLDPVVFFKLCLVGYLENIISDRKLIAHCSMRMDILYFIGYDIEDELPWHSTISRTRQLFPEELFEQVKKFEPLLQKVNPQITVAKGGGGVDIGPLMETGVPGCKPPTSG